MRLVVLGHNDWWVWERQGFSMRNAALVCELSRRPGVDGVAVVDNPRFGGRTHRPRGHRGETVTEVAEKTRAVRYRSPRRPCKESRLSWHASIRRKSRARYASRLALSSSSAARWSQPMP